MTFSRFRALFMDYENIHISEIDFSIIDDPYYMLEGFREFIN